MIKKTDYFLLGLISEKDRKAFALLYDRYIKLIYKFVYQALNDQERTDDLIQEFWIKVWEDPSFLKCNEQGSVQSYMLRNLRFRVLDVYRETLKNMISIDQLEETMEFNYQDITAGLDERELLLVIREALDKQPYVVRKTFWLRINDWSVEETAKVLSVSKKTVYNKYSESLSIVRSHLKNNHPELIEDFNSTLNGKKIFSLRTLFF
ncbi:RNA polymerase sigma factor [Proteiniphilum saccharofermentans]|uniref:RNA polymerase sigma factor n=1 Tax=Proteiniphilum saccharofermentans TaxID=1642647 RepID=A0A1R3T2W7_9BACT|nr:sigma-70 family RNA polymerase sigma factor [Proteiniphilum saccharofermentans]SCD20412.1 RNA polymerase sigma factor [Proteiniphilum saccharofermentans]